MLRLLCDLHGVRISHVQFLIVYSYATMLAGQQSVVGGEVPRAMVDHLCQAAVQNDVPR